MRNHKLQRFPTFFQHVYTRGLELVKNLRNLRENLSLSQERSEEIEEDLTASWKNFFIQLAENGSEDSVLETCWNLMVQNWKLTEKLFRDLQDSSEDGVAFRRVKEKNVDYRNFINVSFIQTETIISSFTERMTVTQRLDSV